MFERWEWMILLCLFFSNFCSSCKKFDNDDRCELIRGCFFANSSSTKCIVCDDIKDAGYCDQAFPCTWGGGDCDRISCLSYGDLLKVKFGDVISDEDVKKLCKDSGCAYSKKRNECSLAYVEIVAIVVCTVAFALALVLFVVCCVIRRQPRKWLFKSGDSSSSRVSDSSVQEFPIWQ